MLSLRRLLALCLIMPAFAASAAFASPEIGKPAPAFTAKDTNGKDVSLAQFKDSIVVLEWTNPGCPFVKKYYSKGDMQALQKDYAKKGVQWVRIISSAPGKEGHMNADDANKVIAEQDIGAFTTLLDESGTIGHAYEAKTTPHMFVIGKDGNLAYMGAIDSIKSPDQADIAKAEPYVKDALDALIAGEAVKTATTQPYGCGVKY